ncbi:MAG: hypothetical protein FJ202_07645 [Gemmatimonadetes bacterium]|nr:hypothetical protein [Gemmatimonadota bacterium]
MKIPGARAWSLDSATAALPLVRRIADDWIAGHERWRVAVADFDVVNAATLNPASTDGQEALDAVMAVAHELDALADELAALNVQIGAGSDGVVLQFATAPGTEAIYWTPGSARPTHERPFVAVRASDQDAGVEGISATGAG